jgi:hypothetical protein
MSQDRPIKFNPTGKYNLDFIDYQNEYERIIESQYDYENAPKESPIYGMSSEKFHELMLKDSMEFQMEQDNLEKQLNGMGIKINKIKKMKIGHSDKDCSICLKNFVKGQVIRLLKCNHIFHDECILPWLEKRSCCPNCRTDLKE